MSAKAWRDWLNRLSAAFRSSRSSVRRKPIRRLDLELLETRLTPSVRTWTGLGTDNLWSDNRNWANNIGPSSGDDLVFPKSALQLTSVNNLGSTNSPFTFKTITLNGGGYTLGGNPIILGGLGINGTITDKSGAVSNNIAFNIQFAGTGGTETFTILPNTLLTLAGQISGSSSTQIKKLDLGTLVLAGDDTNFNGPITINQGAIQIQSATALGSNNTTTVLAGAALQLKNILGPVNETLVISGPGVGAGGALENVGGNNTLAGSITFGANASIGADDSSQLTISGVLSSNGVPYVFTKVGSGQVNLTSANTYAGPTSINSGILNIQDPNALGAQGSTVTVNYDPVAQVGGTLQVQLQNQTVVNKPLHLNGPGATGAGALEDVAGNNIWDGDILLATNAAIGVDGPNVLTIGDPASGAGRGVIREAAPGTNLSKVGTGELLLDRANTYTGTTFVNAGDIHITNAKAVGGSASAGVVVAGRAALELDGVSVDGEALTLNGPGVNNTGALRDINGAVSWSGNVTLATDGSIGADQGTQLTMTGVIGGPGGFTKYGTGEVVLPSADTYLGTTDVHAGVLTVENNTALGIAPPGSTLESGTVVESGASLDLVGVVGSSTGLTITDPLTLAGSGFNNGGALRNINGANLMTGNAVLTANTVIDVESGSGTQSASQLTLTGDITELNGHFSLTKVGPNRLEVSGYNRFTGGVTVAQGILTVYSGPIQNAQGTTVISNVIGDFGLGDPSGGTTVDNGAALELSGGVHVGNEALTLSGTGINNTGALLGVSDDNVFDGNLTFAGNVMVGVATNSRLSLNGVLSDASQGYSLTKAGGGKLVLSGNNTYLGGTAIQAGIVNLQSDSALGQGTAGTTVASGASIEVQAGVSIASQRVIVNGAGPATSQNIPQRWFPLGPAGIFNEAGSNGDGALPSENTGRITAVAADPTNPLVYYIGAATGGIWKTTNGGLNWVPLTDNLPPLTIGAIAVSPSNPNVIYAGTGEANSFTVNFADYLAPAVFYGKGVLKSTDGGQTWTLLGTDHFTRQVISKVVIDPFDPNTVYISTGSFSLNAAGFPNELPLDPTGTGVWKSTDGGVTWTNSTYGPAGIWLDTTSPSQDQYSDLVMDPLDHNNLYTVIGTDVFENGTDFSIGNNGLYESLDGGASWFLDKGLTHDTGGFLTGGTFSHTVADMKMAIGAFVADFPILYIAEMNPMPGSTLKSFQVDDVSGAITGGRGATAFSTVATPDFTNGQAFYDAVLGVNSTADPLTVYAAGAANGPGSNSVMEGQVQLAPLKITWHDISVGKDSNGPHTDHHALAFDAFGKLLDGNDGGVWRLADPTPTAPLWTDLNSNLQLTQLYSISVDPNNPNYIFGGSQDNGTEKNVDNRAWTLSFGGDGGTTIIDPVNPKTIYGNVNSNIIKSTDGGQSWNLAENGITPGPTTFPYLPVVMDPSNHLRLVTGTDQVYVTIDGANNWKAISTPNLNGWESSAPIELVAVANNNPNVIYAEAGGKIFVTVNATAATPTWTERDININGVTINDHFGQLVVDPSNPMVAYIVRNRFDGQAIDAGGGGPVLNGHVFRTTDGGHNWFDITGNLPDVPTWSLTLDTRFNPNVLYVGTDTGVFYSTDLGQHWNLFGVGLPLAQVRTLILDPLHDIITAGTFGRGVWRVALNSDEPPYPPAAGGAMRAITGTNTWSGNITVSGSAPGSSVTVGADIGSTLTLSGSIDDSQAGVGLTKKGPGEVILVTANTYGGPTSVLEGTLDVQDSGALGSNAQVSVANGSTLQLDGGNVNINKHLTLNGLGYDGGTGPIGGLNSINGDNTWAGNITLGSDAALGAGAGASLTIGNPTAGTGVIDDNNTTDNLSKEGLGRVILTAGDTYGGNTNVLAGALNIQNVGALGRGGAKTIVSGGASLELQFPAVEPPPSGPPPVNTISSESLLLNGTGVQDPNTGLFGGALHSISGNNAWASTVTMLGNTTIVVDNDQTSLSPEGSPLALEGSIGDNNTISGLTKDGFGKLILMHSDTYSGGTTVANGVLNIQDSGALGAPTGTAVQSGATLEVQQPSGGNALNIVQPLSLNGTGTNGQGALDNIAGNNTWDTTTQGIVLSSSSGIGVENDPVSGQATSLTITGGTPQPDGTLKGGISGLETSVLNKSGLGVLIFTGPNSYLGQTLVSVGILRLEDGQALGSLGGDGTFVTNGATLQIDETPGGGSLTVTNKTLGLTGNGFNGQGALQNQTGNNTWNGPIILDGSATIEADSVTVGKVTTPTTLTANQPISESVTASSLTKQGTGTLVFTGGVGSDNSYTGTTFINDGTLQLNKTGGAIAIQGDVVVGDGTTGVSNTDVLQLVGPAQLASTSNITVNSDGKFDLNGQNQTIHNLNITGGNVQSNGGTLTVQGKVTASSDGPATVGGTLALGTNGTVFNVTAGPPINPIDLIVSAQVTGTNTQPLTKTGNGTMDLTNANNTYAGPTNVQGGNLLVDGTITSNVSTTTGGAIGGTGTINGTISATNGGGITPGDLGAGTGTLKVNGNVTLDSTSTYTAQLGGVDGSGMVSLLSVNGTLNLNNALLSSTLGFNSTVGDSFTIIHATGGIIGTFATQADGTVFAGGTHFSITYLTTSGTITGVMLTHIVAASQVAVSSSVNPSVYGQAVTFTAQVTAVAPGSGTPSGSVTFVVDGGPGIKVNLQTVGGVSTATYSPPVPLSVTTPVLLHTVSVTYNAEDPRYNMSTGVLSPSQTVNAAPTNTNVTPSVMSPAYGQPVTFTATVTPQTALMATAENPGGTVTFSVDGGAGVQQGLNQATGQATFTPGPLAPGPHTISATYTSADGNFVTSVGSFTETVAKATVNIANVTVTPSASGAVVYSEALTLSTTVTTSISPTLNGTANPTGTVTFYIDGTAQSTTGAVDPVTGLATLTLSSPTLLAGNHTFAASYGGNANYASTNQTPTTPLAIVNANTQTVVTTSAPMGAVYGQTITFTATVTAPAPGTGTPGGSVTFFDTVNNTTTQLGTTQALSGGTAQVSAVLPAGSHTITASYGGAINQYNASTSTPANSVSQTVGQDTVNIAVTPTPSNPIFGQSISFVATVTAAPPGAGNPTGSVSFNGTSENITMATGQTTPFVVTPTSAGTYVINLLYSGDGNFSATPAGTPVVFNQTIATAPTTTGAVNGVPTTAAFGQAITYTTTVGGAISGLAAPTGNVNFLADGVVFDTGTVGANGAVTLVSQKTPGGTHTITAAYVGDTNYSGSKTPAGQGVSITVTKGVSLTSNVTPIPSPALYGQAITFTATVTPQAGIGQPTGQVDFKYGTTTIGSAQLGANGNPANTATFTTTAAALNASATAYNIYAFYEGDQNFNTSQSTGTVPLMVNPAPTQISLSTTSATVVYGNPDVTATVTSTVAGAGTPIGQVTFSVDGTPQAPIGVGTNGTATLPGAALSAGTTHLITASFQGNGNFAASNTLGNPPTSVTVTAANTQVADSVTPVVPSGTIQPTAAVSGQQVKFQANVTAPQSPLTPTGTVTFTINGTPNTVPVDSTGKAVFTTSLLVGTYTTTVSYQNTDGNFVGNTGNTLNLNVDQAQAFVQVTTSNNLISRGQPVTLTATVLAVAPGSGAPSGTVSFVDATTGTPLGSGKLTGGTFSLLVSSLSPGTHAIIVSYSGDPQFAANTGMLLQGVQPADSVTTVTTARHVVMAGHTLTVTATVSAVDPAAGTPTGSVAFYEEGLLVGIVALHNGVASLNVAAIGSGDVAIGAVFASDNATFKTSVGTTQIQVVSTQNQAYIAQVYEDMLRREVDPVGLQGWSGALDAGQSRDVVIGQISHSTEFRGLEVNDAYVYLLHRSADAAGLAAGINFLNAGGSVEALYASLMGSGEYFQVRGGGTNDGFLNAIYQDTFHRPIDPAGHDYFLLLLQQFTPRSSIADQLLTSPEYEGDLVNSKYLAFLHRPADAPGLAHFQQQVAAGQLDAVIVGIIASEEYFGNLAV
jgi:autotransporter-associated beta strand protein